MAITDTLTERLGPLPVWSWGLIGGATIAGGRYVYSRVRPPAADVVTAPGPSTSEAPTSTSSGPAPSYAATSSEAGSFMAAGTYVPGEGSNVAYSPASPDPTTSELRPTDNDEWTRVATTLVVARSSNLSTLQVTEALGAYVNGRPITEQQAAIVELALRAAGVPPYPVAPVQIASPTVAPVLSTPPAAPAPAPYSPPSWLVGVKFVKGTGPAIYLVVPNGIEWVPSEDAFRSLGGSFNPPNYLTIPDSVLARIPRVGAVPDQAADPSLALR